MSLKPILAGIQDRILGTHDTVCMERARLVTEAYRLHAHEPPPIKRALAFTHVVENMTLDLATNPVFAGNTSSAPRAWMLVPEFGFTQDAQTSIEHDDLRDFLNGKIPDDLVDEWEIVSRADAVETG